MCMLGAPFGILSRPPMTSTPSSAHVKPLRVLGSKARIPTSSLCFSPQINRFPSKCVSFRRLGGLRREFLRPDTAASLARRSNEAHELGLDISGTQNVFRPGRAHPPPPDCTARQPHSYPGFFRFSGVPSDNRAELTWLSPDQRYAQLGRGPKADYRQTPRLAPNLASLFDVYTGTRGRPYPNRSDSSRHRPNRTPVQEDFACERCTLRCSPLS